MPSLLRSLCGDAAQVEVEAATVAELLANLDKRCPGIGDRLLNDGRLRRDLAIFVDGEEVEGLAHALRPQSEVNILPAMAGGALPARRRRYAG